MPTLLLLIIAALLLRCSPCLALTEEDIPAINQVKGVLIYKGFEHWLNLAYDYSGNTSSTTGSSSTTSTSHAFMESYNTSLQVALFDPRIFDAILQGSIVFDQERGRDASSSSSSRNTSYQYNFSGSGLDKSRIPFSLLSSRNSDTVLNTFTPATTTVYTDNEFGISFLNNQLQSKVQLSRKSYNSTTSDMTSNFTSYDYSYVAEHHYGGYSTSTLSAYFSDQTGDSSSGEKLTSSSNSFALSNALLLGSRRNNSLTSLFRLDNATTDNLPQRTMSIAEVFEAAFGRALSLNASYSLINKRSSGRDGLVQEDTMNQGEVTLKHKLFESLETELFGAAYFDRLNVGTENKYSVRGNVNYNKRLPAGNQLSLVVGKSYDLVDRQLDSGLTSVNDQLHSAVHQGDVIPLVLAGGTLQNVISVTGRNPLLTYVEGVDYTVNYTLGRITILSGGGVRIDMDGNGTNLYISYTVYKDPQISYATDRLTLASNLSLLDSRIRLGASWSESKQNLIKGPALNSLQDSRSMVLYVTGAYDSLSGRFSYRNETTGSLTFQTVEGNVSAHVQTDKSLISCSVTDGYTIYGGTPTFRAYRENNAFLTASYTRNITANARFTLQGDFNDLRSELRPAKDSLSFLIRGQILLNMVTINMYGMSAWVFNDSSTTRNDIFHVDFTRYF
ncbi:MAG: hypothetical protein WCK54_19820 [Desulfuromonadales bacterium]